MNKRFVIYMLIVVAVMVAVYAYVGGFKQVEITKTTSRQVFIAGKLYEGKADAEELGVLFQEVGKLVEQKKLVGEPAGIYYNNPEKQSQVLRAFIGVAIADTTVTLPAGYKIREVKAGQPILQGTLDASQMIAPKKIYESLFDYAEDNKIKLKNYFVERYPTKDSAVIQIGLE
ncbi:hypothetical protein TH61_06905 [Rufibacter sp. DG15C]|uniref:GyrI-like domain-containing protein n=1 Tax=Rufibacter sp. DG15C TaxID=1379909 RepID=UPI00078D154C|nr:GyrI-like domain-containing protein [Rufibacter sp. DG15C]AMM50963.1 hypothetical protein TH61_06905 [Rufibacter sp. DG15C]